MVWVSVGSLVEKGQPWVGTRYRLADARSVTMVAGENRKPLLDQNGKPIYQLRSGAYAPTVKFLGVSPDGKRIQFQDEDSGEQDDIPISGGGYFVERLSGGRRRTRRARRRTHRKH
jgi:hypothetical protein